MNKITLAVISLAIAAVPSFAGNVDLTATAGLYSAPGGVGTSTMYGVAASQNLTDHLSARLSLQTTTYTVLGNSTTYTPVSLDLIYGQPMPGGVTPYAGIGVSYNSTTTNTGKSETAGAQGLAGVRYNFGGLTAGIEYRYIIPDLSNTGMSASSFDGYATSTVSHSFSF